MRVALLRFADYTSKRQQPANVSGSNLTNDRQVRSYNGMPKGGGRARIAKI